MHTRQTHLGRLGGCRLLAGLLGGGDVLKALLLGLLVLGLVLHEQLEELGGLVLVERLAELVDGRGHLQPLHQDLVI